MQHWDIYWQKTKTLNSFAEGEQGQGYTGEVAKFWRGIFGELATEAKLLDLSTGNGALAVLALQWNDRFVVYASDKANIAPLQMFNEQDSHFKYLQKVKFYGNMPSEELIFSAEEFDIVISQFGFEYAQPEATLQQIHRILKSGGKAVALVHHDESFISRDCKVGLDVLQVFIKQNGLLAKAREFAICCQQLQGFTVLSSEQQQLLKQQSDHLLANFIAGQQSLPEEELDWFNVVTKDLVPVLGDWRSVTVEIIDKLWVNLNHYRQRLVDQRDATWGPARIKEIQQLAEKQGFAVSCSTLNTQGGKFCWVFKATKC